MVARSLVLLLSSILLSSILAPVTPLTCQSCFGSGEDCRNEDMKMMECSGEEDSCAFIMMSTTFTTPPFRVTLKRCSKLKECFPGYYSTTSTDGRYLQGYMSCCQTDNCNAAAMRMPWRHELLPNGLQCPGCFEGDADSCEDTQPMVCLGNENQCIRLSVNLRAVGAISQKYSLQGCSTESTCAFPMGETQVASGLIFINASVNDCKSPMKVSSVWNNVNNG